MKYYDKKLKKKIKRLEDYFYYGRDMPVNYCLYLMKLVKRDHIKPKTLEDLGWVKSSDSTIYNTYYDRKDPVTKEEYTLIFTKEGRPNKSKWGVYSFSRNLSRYPVLLGMDSDLLQACIVKLKELKRNETKNKTKKTHHVS